MISRMSTSLVLLSVFGCLTTAQAGELSLKTQRVIVFKDGHCLVIKKAEGVTDEKGDLFTDQVPDSAVLGTFWALPEKGRLLNMVADWNESEKVHKKKLPCVNWLEVLRANVGKKCSLTMAKDRKLEGTIRQVLVSKSEQTSPREILREFGLPLTTPVHGKPAMSEVWQGSSFVLKSDDSDILVPISSIQVLNIPGMTTDIERVVRQPIKTKRLRFKFAEKNTKKVLHICYFRPGIRWIPTYRIDLDGGKDEKGRKLASMSLQAEILNEAEDLVDVPMDIVVGVPNFRFKEAVSPLILEQRLQRSLLQAAPTLMNRSQRFSNSMYGQRSSEFRRETARAGTDTGGLDLPKELTGKGQQDLFIYNLPKLTLAKKARCAVPIFTARVPYKDVYTWDIQIKHPGRYSSSRRSAEDSPLKLSKHRVWHQVELSNTTRVPWTTGAGLLMQGIQPLAQELLTYTSPGDAVRIPVTVSVGVRGFTTDWETGREPRVQKWDGYHYARIEKKTKIEVCNHKKNDVVLEITLRMGGKVSEASHKGEHKSHPYRVQDWESYNGNPAANNSSVVRWKRTLKPGEVFKPSVDYHYFLRH